jgi:hypothetical protein
LKLSLAFIVVEAAHELRKKALLYESGQARVIKQRIARSGHGKSGGFRTLIVFRAGAQAIFVHGFAKNETDNIGRDELALKRLAAELLAYDHKTLAWVIATGVLVEITGDEKTIP